MSINLKDSVLDIVTKHPEALEILSGLGFVEITNPVMLKTMARFMTLPKASQAKGVPLEKIIEAFRNKGITVEE